MILAGVRNTVLPQIGRVDQRLISRVDRRQAGRVDNSDDNIIILVLLLMLYLVREKKKVTGFHPCTNLTLRWPY